MADSHWRTLASALHNVHARRVDVPDAISVALEDGPLNAEAPAADLAVRLERITHPEPFTSSAEASHQVPDDNVLSHADRQIPAMRLMDR